jgi:peptidoglycan hydrolase-like protein with peptidoglycan-binding domain
MNVVIARLVFLAFLGLTGSIVYNALYLQDLRGSGVPASSNPASADAAKHAPVSTDLPDLEQGDGGSLLIVRAVQRELAMRGYDVGQADGRLSVKTRAAISTYEEREGLAVTGVATEELLHHILLGGEAKPNATGAVAAVADAGSENESVATVKAVQQILADLGYEPGAVDGALGSATAEAISAFQRDRNVAPTGRVTKELLSELKKVTGRDLTKTAAKP